MCSFLLRDLFDNCDAFRALVGERNAVYQTNYTVGRDTPSRWTIDLVVGPGKDRLVSASMTPRDEPIHVWAAIDAKAIMTEHGKARRNRQRDLNSMAEIMHRRTPRPITAAFVVINASPTFRSPLRTDTTQHRNISRIVEETILLFAEILKDESSRRPGLDAIGVVVLDYSNLPGSKCKILTAPPAPDSSSPLFYDNFLATLCAEFRALSSRL